MEVELSFVPLFQGSEKGNDVHTIREQSSVGEKKCVLNDILNGSYFVMCRNFENT